jgi:hypothetical protein
MFWSLLYSVLIVLFLVELALVTWTVNFLRKYAFRPNPDVAHDRETQAWSRGASGLQLARISRPPRNLWAGNHGESAANDEDDLFARARAANRRR